MSQEQLVRPQHRLPPEQSVDVPESAKIGRSEEIPGEQNGDTQTNADLCGYPPEILTALDDPYRGSRSC